MSLLKIIHRILPTIFCLLNYAVDAISINETRLDEGILTMNSEIYRPGNETVRLDRNRNGVIILGFALAISVFCAKTYVGETLQAIRPSLSHTWDPPSPPFFDVCHMTANN